MSRPVKVFAAIVGAALVVFLAVVVVELISIERELRQWKIPLVIPANDPARKAAQ